MIRIMFEMIKELKTPYLISTIFFLVLECITIYWIGTTSLISEPISIWIYANGNVDFFFPLFATIPFCWFFYYRSKSNIFAYIFTRTKKYHYLFMMFLTVSILSFLMAFLVNLVGIIFSLYFVTPGMIGETHFVLPPLPFGIVTSAPFVYGLIASLWRALIFMILTITGCTISLTTNNIFIANLAVFVYVLVENLLTSLFTKPEYSIVTSYSIGRLGTMRYETFTMLTGVLGIILFQFLWVMTEWGRRKLHA